MVSTNEDYDFYQEISISGFGDMLHDDERNQKFGLALKEAIIKIHQRGGEAHVLDIGTGTGLLAMLAVQHGADSVVACEMFPPVANCASLIIKENGFAEKIKLIRKHSTSLKVGPDEDLPRKANILVSEVFDTELIGEGAIKTFNHAHSHLLEEGAIVIPSVGIVYGQVVESETLLQWDRLKEWRDDDQVLVKIPPSVAKCRGTPSLFDIQLSQFPKDELVMLTDPKPLFRFDFMNSEQISTHELNVLELPTIESGKCQAVLIWWDLLMDVDGDIVLSCAPVWHHPDAPKTQPKGNPAKDIPWRDHWMQAVYFLPQVAAVNKKQVLTLRSWHDEFSLWFSVCLCVNRQCDCPAYPPPACDCGVHLLNSRTRLASINDDRRRQVYLTSAKNLLKEYQFFIILGDFSLMGLILSKLGAKKIYALSTGLSSLELPVYNSLIDCNNSQISLYSNLDELVGDVKNDLKNEQICITSEPYFSSSLLPWENFQFHQMKEEILNKMQNLRSSVGISPVKIIIKACCVQFDDLYKIKRPLKTCMGFKMGLFDKLLDSARSLAQAEPEPQPLWEYPCTAHSKPVNILTLDLSRAYQVQRKWNITLKGETESKIDGLAFWADYELDCGQVLSTGPVSDVVLGEYIQWDRCERQGVNLLEIPRSASQEIICTVLLDETSGSIDFSFDCDAIS